MGYVSWMLLGIIILALSFAASVNISLVSLLTIDPTIAPGLAQTGSALLTAVEAANARYNSHNITIHLRQVETILPQNCGEAGTNSARLLAEYYYGSSPKTEGCTAVLAMACNDLANTYALGREFGWMVLINGITSTATVTNPAYPTAVGLGGSSEGLASAVLRFLLIHKWRHVTLLLDTKASTVLYVMEAAGIMKMAKSPAFSSFSAEKIDFLGTNTESIVTALKLAKARSRVLLVLCSAMTALKCLRSASKLGMDNGEYVFVNVQNLQMDSYGTASTFDDPSAEMVNVTRSLFYTTFHEIQAGSERLNAFLAQRARAMYNTTFDNEHPPLGSYAVQATYNIVDLLPQLVLAAIDRNVTNPCDSAVLTKLAMERPYLTTVGRVEIDRQKVSELDVDFFAFNTASHKMKPYAYFNFSTTQFIFAENFTVGWLTGNPPEDIPACGYSGRCVATDNFLVVAISIPVCLVASVILLLGLFRRYFLRPRARSSWWMIHESDMQLPSVSGSRQSGQQVQMARSGAQVWIDAIACDGACIKQDQEHLRKLLRFCCLPHPNVNTFHGLCFKPGSVLLVSEYCRRGSLRDVIGSLPEDLEFRLSLIADFAKGLLYLHQQLGPHGFLTPSCGLLDSHFTLKVGKHSYHEIGRLLHGVPVKDKFSAWTAPETAEPACKKTKAGDVYSTGLIMDYILSGKQPFLANSEKRDGSAYASRFQSLIGRCLDVHPQKRIALLELSRTVQKIGGTKLSGRSAVEYMLKKMAQYASTLETAVVNRTNELQSETGKCDTILMQILPEFVVSRLRSQTLVLPELFDSVSICFSQVENFSLWISSMNLLQVMDTLAGIHGILDSLISSFSVFRIEAVNDCYVVASGIPVSPENNHAAEICRMALAHRARIGRSDCSIPVGSFLWGIHTGACAAGIVGTKTPRYLLFGDTVNVASRMMSHGVGGAVHLSESTAQELGTAGFRRTRRGAIYVKGKGNMITYWLDTDADPVYENPDADVCHVT